MIEKYGVKVPAQNPEILEQIKKTTLERHGVECILQLYNQKGWRNPRANLKVWAKSLEFYDYYVKNKTHGAHRMATNLKIKKTKSLSTIIKEFKNGWNPYEDYEFLESFNL